ncbi:glycoside hydrolase [Delitschia confertaspora ATCC 74209]|uniref:Glycoside hydrolase n=1 Tax=Delitschia confertaspora ATCC 74209 TaxID=1513339 RepID=A0A9P4MWE3_9PLEO|nr:glycoside hydrolase [Delitschia confertaspora ATCC 74209]
MHFTTHLAALAAIPFLIAAAPSLETRQSSQKITVDTTKKYQTIDGFGFSAAFQRANLIVNLAEPKQSQLLDLLFNTTTGAGFSIVRNGIGSSQDSRKDYMNTILPKCPASPSDPPNYVWDGKDSGQLWLSQQAVRYGVSTFYANAWSAPGCMKSNGNDANGGMLCGISGSNCKTDWKQAFANYLVKYIQLYAEAGVKVTHLGFLNEPDYTTAYASMNSNGAQAAEFIKTLHPTLAAANLSSVGINCCDATGWSVAGQHASALRSSGVEDKIYAVTSHEYTSRINSSPLNTRAKVWQTEYSDLNGGWSTSWYQNGGSGDGYTWANTVFNGIVNANLSAYIFWEGVQDRATNNNNNEKLILVDNGSYTVSKRLWAFAQFRVVRPGAVRVGASGGSGLKSAAFVNADGSIAVVAINTGTGAQSLSVAVPAGTLTGAQAKAWVTDNSHAMDAVDVTMGADSVTASVPGRGMISFLVSKPANATVGGKWYMGHRIQE